MSRRGENLRTARCGLCGGWQPREGQDVVICAVCRATRPAEQLTWAECQLARPAAHDGPRRRAGRRVDDNELARFLADLERFR